MPGQDLVDAIEAARHRPGPAQLEEVFRIALLYSADDRACRDVLDRLTRTHRAEVARAWADHHAERLNGRTFPIRWHAGPTHEGWYAVHRRVGPLSDVRLIRVEAGGWFAETGEPIHESELDGAKWLGPVESP